MTARAEAASATKARILASGRKLLADTSFDGMTLEAIAAGAETTVRTVLRLFGSKELLFASTLDSLGETGIGPVSPGDCDTTLGTLYDFYERIGDTVIRWLADEPRVVVLREHLNVGRRHLRAWVAASFAPTLARLRGTQRKRRIHALIVALDVYTWKILRRDLGLSRKAAQAVARRIIVGLTEGE
jgi:AcrR family transcriptional regulator